MFKKKTFMAFFTIFALLTQFSCDDQSVTKINENDNGKTINVKTGDKINVSLVSNPSTGYCWIGPEITGDDITGDVSQRYLIGASCDGRDGCPGTEEFEFGIDNTGKCDLQWRYQRSWEIGPVKTFGVSLVSEK